MTRRSSFHLTWSLLGLMISAAPAWAENWSLTNQERRLYLGYYAPVIFKNADEGARKHHGYDWITNFDFDRDGVFSNNKANWEDIDRYVSSGRASADTEPGGRRRWQIRPTLYTAIIEFMQDGRKSVILLYHIYHAKQQRSIHDWERVEIRIDGVTGLPGGGAERIAYAVITTHRKHDRRVPGDADLNFWQTGFGKHLMIWQAPWSEASDLYRGELHWVADTARAVAERRRRGGRAQVRIAGAPAPRDVNYIFLCDCDPEATAGWDARRISRGNAADMAAKTTGGAPWRKVPGISYELQDLADILPTHWSGNPYHLHWTVPYQTIVLESPILSETGGELVPAGRQRFYAGARDIEDGGEHRKGYTGKHWFWGTYLLGWAASFTAEAFLDGTPSGERGPASGRPEAHGRYWWQHDYFAHDGAMGIGMLAGERGEWLPGAWYSAAKGGFDGRWVQLFADNPLELEARVPVAVDRVTPRTAELLDLAKTTASSLPQ